MRVRLFVKRLLQRLHLASWLIEFCHDCGIRQPLVWLAPSAMWTQVMGDDGRHGSGVVCPMCFDKRADARGLGLVHWVPSLGDYPAAILAEWPRAIN